MRGDKENQILHKAEISIEQGEGILMIGGVFSAGSMITAELAAALAFFTSDIIFFEDGLVLALTIGVPALLLSAVGNIVVVDGQRRVSACLEKIAFDKGEAAKKLEEEKVKEESQKGQT